jgi:tRNA threonylcarbamoyladenosine biosynthesis protein TsaE
MKEKYIINQPADFQVVIKDILDLYKKEDKSSVVIALTGELGAGKTAFTKELGKVIGIDDVITSPTFTVMKQYELDHDDFDMLFHIDAYRIESQDELEPLHINELFEKERAIVVVEWPGRISSVIPRTAMSLIIKIIEENKREVIVQKTNK